MELKERRQAKIGNFKGVDFSSSPLLVAQNRAVNCKNFIYENGVNRKRNGWIESYRVGSGNINGIFECVLERKKTILIYSGTQFYTIVDDEITNITNTSTNASCRVNVDRLKDRRCQMFISQNRCYFVGCGDYLTYGKYGDNYELRRVEDDDNTYIPTTTINKGVDGEDNDIVETLESPNLLTCKRKNTFVGNEANSVFTVDAESIDEGIQVIVEHETLNDSGELITKIYKSNGETLFYNETESVGTIDFVNGKITFSIDTKPVLDAEPNLIVTFGCKVDGYADRINNSEIGVMFGVNGNPDRLFVAGSDDFPNYDFYSEMNNLTYFGHLNSCMIGSSDSKIVGYSRLGDGTLATHKETVNGEASIYYRTGSYNTEYNEDGSLLNLVTYFPIQAGTIGEGMVSKYANANLSGDKLYLSKNGVYGIVLSSNLTSSERYSRERSQYISEKLRQHNLENAVGIAFDNKYYLAIDNVCYIADARMTSQSTSDTNSYNYEWYYWDNMPVRVWGVVDGKLCFGTTDGRICSFDDKYVDRIFEHTSLNDLMLDYDNNEVVYNTNLGVKENDCIAFKTDVFKLKMGAESIVKVEDNRVYLNEEEILSFYNETEVYADNGGDSGLSVNKKYYIYDVDVASCSFALKDESGNQVDILADGFRLCENLVNRELLTTSVNSESFKLKRTKDDATNIILVKYNNNESYQTPIANFTIKTNVCALWYSPMFDFGTNQAMKTLLKVTISTEPTTNGQIDFGYSARDSEASLKAQGINIFDFEALDFNNFTFNSSFANSYTVDIKDYFNFIQFFFKSDNEYDCVIHSITITYKINSTNKGVQ